MNQWKNIFQSLREKLFGEKHMESSVASPSTEQGQPIVIRQAKPEPQRTIRDPYIVQIGFDFGTSFSKCICRDIRTEKAWIYIPTGSGDREFPFLIPCSLQLREGKLGHMDNTQADYHENGLYHIKRALEKVALQQWSDAALEPYQKNLKQADKSSLATFVRTCAVYFLAGVLSEIKEDVRRRLPEFGTLTDDYIAVNLAVPVADAERPQVNSLYHQVLSEAWILSDLFNGHPIIGIEELKRLASEVSEEEKQSKGDSCFIYPETSANVQGFVRSRVSSPGIYLFSDTGAGTVDQSVFIFLRHNGKEHLTYLHGNVIPLGSSFIERRAASAVGKTEWEELEKWRIRKENGEIDPLLTQARNSIHDELSTATHVTLAKSKQKLMVRDQLEGIRVIFGGGGHCGNPYKTAVMSQFSGGLFRRTISPDVIGMPVPNDLELDTNQTRWISRLSVAYGLSFEKSDLVRFTYPVKVEIPNPEEIWRPHRLIREAPTKDEC